jgi:hypothetical protein
MDRVDAWTFGGIKELLRGLMIMCSSMFVIRAMVQRIG